VLEIFSEHTLRIVRLKALAFLAINLLERASGNEKVIGRRKKEAGPDGVPEKCYQIFPFGGRLRLNRASTPAHPALAARQEKGRGTCVEQEKTPLKGKYWRGEKCRAEGREGATHTRHVKTSEEGRGKGDKKGSPLFFLFQ